MKKVWKKISRKKSYLIIGTLFALAIIIILLIRFASGEDNWICKNGNWIKHGNPASPMPKENCKK